ncbi:MAG: hypothetical protein H6722_34850, partial [Sandaracinus sp.]|nr:hypothetical protein [Sandaracinus sp.]
MLSPYDDEAICFGAGESRLQAGQGDEWAQHPPRSARVRQLASGRRHTCFETLRDTIECTDALPVPGTCGDEFVDLDEVCDDGNRTSGDGCAADCQSDETCGNGVRDVGEACDSESVCTTECTLNLDGVEACGPFAYCPDNPCVERVGCVGGWNCMTIHRTEGTECVDESGAGTCRSGVCVSAARTLSAGDAFACENRGGELQCWGPGAPSFGPSAIRGPWREVEVGTEHVCVSDYDGGVDCAPYLPAARDLGGRYAPRTGDGFACSSYVCYGRVASFTDWPYVAAAESSACFWGEDYVSCHVADGTTLVSP